MKKRVLISCLLLSLVMMLSCVMAFGVSAAETVSMTEVAAGAEIGDKEVTISTADELYALADYVANGGVTEGKVFRLIADIELPGVTGNAAAKLKKSNSPDIGTAEKPFKGTLFGDSHVISNIIISVNGRNDSAAAENRGIFAYTEGAVIEGAFVDIKSVAFGVTNVGGLVGYAKNTTVALCGATGTATASTNNRLQKNVGGLIGTADGCTVSHVSSTVTVSGLENVGGVVGLAKNETTVLYAVSGAEFSGAGSATGITNFGGIVGKMENSALETCFVLGASVSDANAAVIGVVAGDVDADSTVCNGLIDVKVGAAVVGKAAAGAKVEKIYASMALTGAVAFDDTYKLASAVTVADVQTDNALGAVNLYIDASSYAEKLFCTYGAGGYAFVECAQHTRPDGAFACEDVLCVTCSIPMAALSGHVRPADAKACATGVMCDICNKVEVAGAAHTIPENTPACKEGVACEVCQEIIAPTKQHRVLGITSCTNIAQCEDCGKMMAETTTPHDWDGNQTCATDEICKVCKQPNPEKLRTGNHIKNIPAPTCTEAVKCTVCTKMLTGEDGKLLKALGHDESGAEPNCGYAKICAREGCNHVIADATGAHTIDWDNAEVIREPSPDKAGLVIGTCSVCNKTQEKYPKYEAPDEPGDETPDEPGDETPDEPGDETPNEPGDETPNEPGDETPNEPGNGEKDHTTCTASGWTRFWNSIMNFFRRLFGAAEVCVCGETLPKKE